MDGLLKRSKAKYTNGTVSYPGTFLILSFTNKLMTLQWEDQNLQSQQKYVCKLMNKLQYPRHYNLQKFGNVLLMTFIPFLTLSLPVTACTGHKTNLPSNSNISEMVRVNLAFTFFKEYFTSFLIITWLIDFALVVI